VIFDEGLLAEVSSQIIMKIRTITTGFNLDFPLREEQFRRIALFTNNCKRAFEDEGYVVQTARVATQPWGKHSESREQIVGTVKCIGKSYTQI